MESAACERCHQNVERTLGYPVSKAIRPQVKYKDVPIYDGTSSRSFKAFLNDFESLAQLGVWTEEEKLLILPTRLRKRPKLMFRRLKHEKKETFEMAIEALRTLFDSTADESILKKELHSIKQQNYLSFFKYLERIEYLFTELDVHPDKQLDFFMTGLNPDSHDYIYMKQSPSYEDAVNSLKLKLSIKKDTPQGSYLLALHKKLKSIQDELNRRSNENHVYDSSQNTLHETINEKASLQESKIVAVNCVQRQLKNKVSCFECGVAGHFARNCWSKSNITQKRLL